VSKRGHVIVPTFIRELLSLIPPEYLLLLEQDAVSLIRLSSRSRGEIIRSKRLTTVLTRKEITDLFGEMRQAGEYYGQPLTVVANRQENCTYARRVNKSDSAGIYARVRLLQQDNSELQTQMFQKHEDKIFVAQAFDKDLITFLCEALEEAGVYAERVISLSTVLIRDALNARGSANSIAFYRLPRGNTVYLIQDVKGNVFFNNLESHKFSGGLEEMATSLRETFFGPGVDVEIDAIAETGEAGSSIKHRPLAAALRRATRSSRKLGNLAMKTNLSRLAVAARIAVNSARLLAMVLGAAFILSALSAGITGLAAMSDEDSIETYQEFYGAKLSLERTRDSLLSVESQVSASRRPTRELAPVVSAFFQRKFNPLALTRIYVSNVSAESTFVEISGSAENEDIIFKYIDVVSPYVSPYNLNMSSMQPDIRNMRGASDTTVTFKLRIVAD